MQKPCRLELNNSGTWKLLGRFDAAVEDATDDILMHAGHLVDSLNDPATGRTAIATLRMSIDEAHPTVLMRYDSQERCWRDAATGDAQ